jgi:hypothetical protein
MPPLLNLGAKGKGRYPGFRPLNLQLVAGGLQCTEPASLVLPFRFELVEVAA